MTKKEWADLGILPGTYFRGRIGGGDDDHGEKIEGIIGRVHPNFFEVHTGRGYITTVARWHTGLFRRAAFLASGGGIYGQR